MSSKILLPSVAAILVLAAFTFNETRKATPACTACENLTGVEKIVCLANDFKASLSSSQVTTLQLSYNLNNAATWSNLPVTFVPRLGIRFGDLNATQLAKAKALVEASLGTDAQEGYSEIQELWAADEYLGQNGGGTTYDEGQYYMAFLGEPSTTGTWELQTGGHHVAVANTYANGQLAGATPSFRAVEPFAAFTLNGTTYQPMIEERDALAAMLAGLSTAQLASAKITSTFNDIVLGPGKDWQFPTTKVGLKCSELNASQKALVLAAMATYVNDIADDDAAQIMATYTAQLDDTYIAYANNATLTNQKDYVRIDGPRVWIEYSVQNGIVLNPVHPHSVWRDHQSDYGGLGGPSATQNATPFTGKFELAPNPATSATQVALELEKAATVSVTLFDSTGKQVSDGLKFNMTSGAHVLPVQISHLPKGLYICTLQVKTADGSIATASKQLSKM